jgi:hypothetical protein
MFNTPAHLRRPTLLAIVVALLLCAGCHRTDLHSTLAANSFIGSSGEPMMLAAYLPWFGRPGHINVGYSSQDRVVMEKQIDKAKQLGIGAFVINWYGQHQDFEDKSYTLMQQVAGEKSFKVALMYDEDAASPPAPPTPSSPICNMLTTATLDRTPSYPATPICATKAGL